MVSLSLASQLAPARKTSTPIWVARSPARMPAIRFGLSKATRSENGWPLPDLMHRAIPGLALLLTGCGTLSGGSVVPPGGAVYDYARTADGAVTLHIISDR